MSVHQCLLQTLADTRSCNIWPVRGYGIGPRGGDLGHLRVGEPKGYYKRNLELNGGFFGTHLAITTGPYIVRQCLLGRMRGDIDAHAVEHFAEGTRLRAPLSAPE